MPLDGKDAKQLSVFFRGGYSNKLRMGDGEVLLVGAVAASTLVTIAHDLARVPGSIMVLKAVTAGNFPPKSWTPDPVNTWTNTNVFVQFSEAVPAGGIWIWVHGGA